MALNCKCEHVLYNSILNTENSKLYFFLIFIQNYYNMQSHNFRNDRLLIYPAFVVSNKYISLSSPFKSGTTTA